MSFNRSRDLLKLHFPDLVASKRKLRLADAIACVRMKRQEANQNLGFTSRPFVLCGLPVKRPQPGQLLHERRNGHFLLQVTGHPSYGLPWGQDRLVPIFLATQAIRQKSPQIVFESAAEMLSTFGMQQGGSQYRRLVASFQRIFGATIFFGTNSQSERTVVVHRARFSFMTEARIWYSRDPEQKLLPGDCQNRIVLSERVLPRDSGPSDSDRLGGRQSALVVTGGARSLHVAFLSMLHSPRNGTRAAVRRIRPSQPLGSVEYARPRRVSGQDGPVLAEAA